VSEKKGRNNIQRVPKITTMQVTFTGNGLLPSKNPNVQVKDKLWGKKCWLREMFRLIVAAIDEIMKTIHELWN
jgi:hypothetical protein